MGVAAVLYATNFSSIQASVASGLELTVITAAVVGGVSILGGSGTVVGAIMGAILLQIIGTAMVFLHVRAEWFQTIQGSLILMTILLDVFRRRKTVEFRAVGRRWSWHLSPPGWDHSRYRKSLWPECSWLSC